MRVVLIHPPLDRFPSGGNIYDANLLREARLWGFPLDSFVLEPEGSSASGKLKKLFRCRDTLVVWDSLFLPCLAASSFRLGQGSRHGLLWHYRPSENPLLTDPGRTAWRQIEDSAARKAGCFLVTGHNFAGRLARRYPGRSIGRVCPGVDPAFFPPGADSGSRAGSETVQLLTVANFRPAKGQLELASVLHRLSHGKWHWHLVGDDRGDPACFQAFIQELAARGLTGRVTLHGALPSRAVAGLMREADLFLYGSQFEGYGMALAEAAACGLPVISFRVGDACRLVRHGITGFLAPPGQWALLRFCLQTVLERPGLLPAFRRNRQGAPVRRWGMAFDDFRKACEHGAHP